MHVRCGISGASRIAVENRGPLRALRDEEVKGTRGTVTRRAVAGLHQGRQKSKMPISLSWIGNIAEEYDSR
jgi:hypothetical protein